MIRWHHLVLYIVIISFFSACGEEALITEDTATASAPSEVFTTVQEVGLTCEAQQSVRAFNETQGVEFSNLLQEGMSIEQFDETVQNRELGCATEVTLPGTTGTSAQAITTNYVVEKIEENYSYSGSWGGSIVYRDGPAFNNMCGPDSDYIVEFDSISGAFSNRSSLKVVGLSSDADCMLAYLWRHFVDSRVYSDNDIRACVGYWSTVWCGGAPVSGDFWIHK